MQGLKHSFFVFTARTENTTANLVENFKSKMECFYIIDRFIISPRTKGAWKFPLIIIVIVSFKVPLYISADYRE